MTFCRLISGLVFWQHGYIFDYTAFILALITGISECLFRAYTPQGYKTPTAEKTRPVRAATATPTSAQLSSLCLSSSAPKALYGKGRQPTWQNEDTSSSPLNTTTSNSDSSNSKKYVRDYGYFRFIVPLCVPCSKYLPIVLWSFLCGIAYAYATNA